MLYIGLLDVAALKEALSGVLKCWMLESLDWSEREVLSGESIKHRAIMMGICTGSMPEVEFIWSVQESEGMKPCFGQGRDCQKADCNWRNQCQTLEFYANEHN